VYIRSRKRGPRPLAQASPYPRCRPWKRDPRSIFLVASLASDRNVIVPNYVLRIVLDEIRMIRFAHSLHSSANESRERNDTITRMQLPG